MAHSAFSAAGRTLSRAGATVILIGLLAGVPAGLALAIGWPLPTSVPTSWDAWQQLLTGAISDSAILNLLACAGWLLWAAFTRAVWVEAKAAWRGVRAPTRLHTRLSPLRTSAAFLIAAITAGSLATGATAATRPAHAAAPSPPAAGTVAEVIAAQAGAGPAAAQPEPAVSGAAPPTTVLVSAHTPLLPAGQGVLVVAGCHHLYTVVKGDSLWDIAKTCLGDGQRWTEIWDLNKGRFWPAVSGYTRLHDPDLIYPRWTLTLPAGAHPPAQTAEVVPADPPPGIDPPPAPTSTPAPTASPTTMPSAPAIVDPDGVVGAPTAAATSGPEATLRPGTGTTSNPTAPGPPAAPTPAATSSEHGAATAAPRGGDDGVELPAGSWIPWALAGALVSAMAVVWLQRRRRYLPRRLDGSVEDHRIEPADPPTVLRHIQIAWRTRIRTDGAGAPAPATSPTAQPPPVAPPPAVVVPEVPQIDALPPGGLGLLGPGAEAAARGALVAALAAGAPTDPDARTEVVMPVEAVVTLLGADAVTLGTWPRLRVTADLDEALAVLEERLLFAARILDDNRVDDVTTLLREAPFEEPVPPLLLIAAAPPAGIRARARMILGLGSGVQVSAVLLGEWAHGATARVDAGGGCHPTGEPATAVPDRMAVLDAGEAYDLLRTLREAHTGDPDPAPHPGPVPPGDAGPRPPAGVSEGFHNDEKVTGAPSGADEKRATSAPGQAHETEPADADVAHDTDSTADDRSGAGHCGQPGVKARIRVLGRPEIVDRPPGETMRSYATEVMVHLAVHADGATPEQILEDLWPGERRRTSAVRLHTGVSNLRKLLGESVGAEPAGFVGKQRGRYRLNPDAVDVDLWRLREGHAAARANAGIDDTARIAALRRACDAYTAPLADGEDYQWIESYREGARGLAVDVHTALATALEDTDPAEAARMLDAAVGHDPANEQVYRQAMRARHRLGDADAIRSLLRGLTLALGELDAEPDDTTVELADRLRRDLEQRRPAA